MKKLILPLTLVLLSPITAVCQTVLIIEVDADDESTHNADFLEIYDGGAGRLSF